MSLLKSLRLSGFLSFPPDAAALDLLPLNVLIGPNGSGKSNLIEAIELLRAAPVALAAAIRDGGGAPEWLWKGDLPSQPATIEAVVAGDRPIPDLRYRLTFASANARTEIVDEAIEEAAPADSAAADGRFYYRYENGHPVLNIRDAHGGLVRRSLRKQELVPDESVLSQRKGAEEYPEITWLGRRLAKIQTFREWSFGRFVALRQPQPADLPSDELLPDARNLGLLLNELEHAGASGEFNRLLTQFLPRYRRFSTRIGGGTVQFYVHEAGLATPVPATRLSDGTLRFMAILALLLSPAPPPLICLEEPELGLHPDAAGLLAELLVDASARTQLIVTTHSDALISGLSEQANSVLVCEHLAGTTVERVDADKLAFWLEKFRLGEVWRIGELGGNP